MNNRPVPRAVGSEGTSGHAARFPHLTREDLAVLRALGPVQARAFESLIREQHRGEREYRAHHVCETDLGGPGALEQTHGQHTARWSYGPGGGHRTESRSDGTS